MHSSSEFLGYKDTSKVCHPNPAKALRHVVAAAPRVGPAEAAYSAPSRATLWQRRRSPELNASVPKTIFDEALWQCGAAGQAPGSGALLPFTTGGHKTGVASRAAGMNMV